VIGGAGLVPLGQCAVLSTSFTAPAY